MKRILNIIPVLAIVLLITAPVFAIEDPVPPEAEEYYNRVLELFEAGKYEEAIPIMKQVLEICERTLGANHPKTADSLQDLADLYREAGRYSEAEPLYERALRIRQSALGPGHPDVAQNLNNMGLVYDSTGRYDLAEAAYKKALAINESALGAEHQEVAVNLNNLATLHYTAGRYKEAEPLFRRALVISEKAFGSNHENVATTLNNLAMVYDATADYASAEPMFVRALKIYESVLGADHPAVATTTNSLAVLYDKTGRYGDAEMLYKKALKIYEASLGSDHPNVAMTLNNMAIFYKDRGRYAEAEPLYKRALSIWEKAYGPDHPDVASALDNMAVFYDTTGRYADAEPMYKRALNIRERALGTEHPDVANSLDNLSSFYTSKGRYAEAEPLSKRAVGIWEKAVGAGHPSYATSLVGLADIYRKTLRYAEAEPLYKSALGIKEKVLGPLHLETAVILNSLAALYDDTGRFADSEPLYKRALEIQARVYGEGHPESAISLNNLALIYMSTGRHAEAEPLLKKSLAIREKSLSPDHPDVAQSLTNIAGLYRETGRPEEAERYFKKSLGIWESAFGPNHPEVAKNLNNLALLYPALDRHPESHRHFARSYAIKDANKESVFSVLSERQKLSYVKDAERGLHAFISHTRQYLSADADAVSETLDAWLRWKSAVMEAQGRYIEAVYRSGHPDIKGKFDKLNTARRSLAKLHMSGPQGMPAGEYKAKTVSLQKEKDALEAELSRLSRDYSLQSSSGKADVKTISKMLPKESVYVDFASIRDYDFKSIKWGGERYVAFIVSSDSTKAVLVDLGDADAMDALVKRYRMSIERFIRYSMEQQQRALKKTGARAKVKDELNAILKEQKDTARALYEGIIRPMEPHIKDAKTVFISPDGGLNLLPFEALTGPDGKYLIEGRLIHYIGAGRDIARFGDTSASKAAAYIIADPDYDLSAAGIESAAKELNVAGLTTRGGETSRDLRSMKFDRLPDTKAEADRIGALLKGKNIEVKSFTGRQALEAVIYEAESPKILHLATHGYFLKTEESKQEAELTGSAIDPGIENPMLRSGMAFAGANVSLNEGRDEGLASAEKLLGLRLRGTELVVLSACETGVGEVDNGEGVFGLKRAFLLSGAKTVVMSLWSVPSAETAEMMSEFYGLWQSGMAKSSALREAKLRMMKKKGNPFYWAAFTMSGNPD